MQSSHMSPRMAGLRQGNALISLPYLLHHRWAAQVISPGQAIVGAYSNKISGRVRVQVTEADPA